MTLLAALAASLLLTAPAPADAGPLRRSAAWPFRCATA